MDKLAGTIHRSQDPDLAASAGQIVRQRESRASQQGEHESKECRELLDASLKFRCSQVRHVQTNHDLRCLAKPPTGRRARDSEVHSDGHVPGALDESSKPVVVALLRAGRGRRPGIAMPTRCDNATAHALFGGRQLFAVLCGIVRYCCRADAGGVHA
jgi:hypothetical protein